MGGGGADLEPFVAPREVTRREGGREGGRYVESDGVEGRKVREC